MPRKMRHSQSKSCMTDPFLVVLLAHYCNEYKKADMVRGCDVMDTGAKDETKNSERIKRKTEAQCGTKRPHGYDGAEKLREG